MLVAVVFESYTDADEDRLKTFYYTRLEIDPCCDVVMGEPVEVTVWFRTDGTFKESDALFIDLPSETRRNMFHFFNIINGFLKDKVIRTDESRVAQITLGDM